jgi:hypothetical protein
VVTALKTTFRVLGLDVRIMNTKEETKEQTTIYKRSHRKLKIEQHESHHNSGEKSGAQEG